MSAVAGIFHRNGAPVERRDLEQMMVVRPERGPDGQGFCHIGHAGLVHQHFWLTPEEWGEKQPLQSGEIALSCDARLDNRRELCHKLQLNPDEAKEASDAALILLSYQRWGVDCLCYFTGDFAFALWDDREQKLFLARDALGARDLCYYIDQNRCLFGSEISHILAHPSVEPCLNDNKVAARMGQLWDKPEETYYKNISYLPPAHGMTVTAERVRLWRYWDVDRHKIIRYQDEQEYADQYRELLAEAVRCRLRTVGPVGISLSGGLDSSALAATAVPLIQKLIPNQERLLSFSYVFDELHSCDEREYIGPMVERYDLQAAFLPCDDKWTLKNLEEWPASRDTVYADPYILLPATVLAAAEKRGIRLLLGGYYGDTLFSGGRYWALDMMRRLHIGPLLQTLANNYADIDWRQALFEDGVRQLQPRRAVNAYRRWRPRRAAPHAQGIHPDLLARTDLLQRLALDGAVNDFSRPGQGHRYRTLTLSVFSQGIAASRHWYNRHGLELAMPYYDRRLVEFVMAIPADELGRPGQDRRTARKAMNNLVPEAILNRGAHTSFIPLRNKGLLVKEKETVKKILADPMIVERKYIDPDWLQKQKQNDLELTPDAHLLWYAISLELWLQRYWT